MYNKKSVKLLFAIGTFITVVGTLSLLSSNFNSENKKKPVHESITEIRENIIHTLIPSLLIEKNFQQSAIFLYDQTYSNRYLVYSGQKNIPPVMNVLSDPQAYLILEHHRNHLCYIQTLENMYENSPYSRLLKAVYVSEHDSTFLISCPIFSTSGVLKGYVSAVMKKSGNGVVTNLQAVRVLAKEVEKVLNSL